MGGLVCDGCLPADVAPVGAIVVAHEQPRRGRQGQHPLDAVPQLPRIAAGKVRPGRPAVGHEQRIADKGRIAHHMRHAGGRVAGGVDRGAGHLADRVGVAIIEQPVELRPVALEFGAFVEHLAERVLHHGDVTPDPDPAAQLALDIGRGGQMVGVDMGFDQPFDRQALDADKGDDLLGVVIGDPPGGIVDVHHAVDDRAGVAGGVADDIADRVGGRIEKAGHFGLYGQIDGHGELLSPRRSARLTGCGPGPSGRKASPPSARR